MRRTLLLSVALGVMLFVSGEGCTTDYQQGLEDPRFGGANALAGQKQPGPSSDTATGDGGGGNNPVCVKSGGKLVDGGACTVSFKGDILPAFSAASCQTAGSCHGGATPPNQPRIDPTDAPGMWTEFANFKLSTGLPYINPCSTDPAQATVACNVNGLPGAGCGKVMPTTTGLAADVVTKIDTWLKCGSPNN